MQGGSIDSTANHGNTPVLEQTEEVPSNFPYPPPAAATADLTVPPPTTLTENLPPVSRLHLSSDNPGFGIYGEGAVNDPTFDGKVDLIIQVCHSEDESVLDDVTRRKGREFDLDLASTWSDDDDSLDLDWGGISAYESVGTNTLNGYSLLYHPPQPLSPQRYGDHTVARRPSPSMLNFPRLALGINGPVGQPYGALEAFLPGNEYAEADAAASRTPLNGTLLGPWDHVLNPTTPEDFAGDASGNPFFNRMLNDFQGTSMEPPFPDDL